MLQLRALSRARSESIEHQGYPHTDVIVVDDGSTDGTARIASAHRARLIRQRNSGLSAARNVGLAAAKGEFVLFLDADDELLPEAVASGVAALSAEPELACVVRRCQVIDEHGQPLPARYPDIGEEDDLYRRWLRENFVWTPGAAMFRADGIRAVGGFPLDVGAAADYAVYLQLSRLGAVAFKDRVVVRYRQHESNMSRDPVLMLKSTLSVYARERPVLPAGYRAAFDAGRTACRAAYGEANR